MTAREAEAAADRDLAAGVLSYMNLANRLGDAHLYLVTQQMTRMAVDAARDVPAGQRFDEVWPHRTGIMAFSGGLPPVETPAGFEVSPSVLTWCIDIDTIYFQLWAFPGSSPEFAKHAEVAGIPMVPIASCQHPWGEWDDAAWDGYRPHSVRMMSLALSAWTLMQMPTVAETVTRTEAGAKLRSGKRDLPREVKVIDMRRLARKPRPEDGEEGDGKRTYTHQWVVRGHWRQQPVGKGRSERRTTWVPSYLKGPEGAPFLPSETVFVWRR